ncbi:tRNA (adenine22-N1)-methyltransferase [Clostridiales Family XIII bacterium PM5-7]
MMLSDRLALIANQINQGETMADIGTDHGFLPIHLWETEKCPKVIMADISEQSLQKAMDNCTERYPEQDFDFRLGNGIDVLANGEVENVVIAGMGGILITDILGWDLVKSHSINKYILQPRTHTGVLRRWLANNGFSIVRELLVRESKFIWEILVVTNRTENSSTSVPTSDEEFDYPDSLLTFRGPLTAEFLQNRLAIETGILQTIVEHSKNAETASISCQKKIKRIEHLLSELEKLK